MKHRFIISIMAVFLVAVFTGVSLAAGPNGNARKGKYTYRKIYKKCAARGEIKARRPFISPSDKTMSQWKRIFETKAFDEFKCKKEWNALSDADRLDIYTYLYKHAADSPTPAKCK